MNSSGLRQLRRIFVESKARKDDVLKEMEHIDDEMKRMAKRKEEILKDVDSINANLNSIHNNCENVAHKLRDDLEQFTEITTDLSVILGRDSIQGLLKHALFNNDSPQEPSPAEPARTQQDPSREPPAEPARTPQDPSREPPAESIEGLLELAVFNNDSSQDPSRGPQAEPDRTLQDPSREPTAELNRRLSRDPSAEPTGTPSRRFSLRDSNRRLSRDPPAELNRRLSRDPSAEPTGTPSIRWSLRDSNGKFTSRKTEEHTIERLKTTRISKNTSEPRAAGKKRGRPRKSAMGNLISSLSNK